MKDNGGPAFPGMDTELGMREDGKLEYNLGAAFSGMSLRDWFAGMAMTSLVDSWANGDSAHAGELAQAAYVFADAMLVVRK